MQRKSQLGKKARKAKVAYSTGGTINLGNYENSKFAIGLELECLENEVEECFAIIKQTVDAMAKNHMNQILGESDG